MVQGIGSFVVGDGRASVISYIVVTQLIVSARLVEVFRVLLVVWLWFSQSFGISFLDVFCGDEGGKEESHGGDDVMEFHLEGEGGKERW